MGERRFRRVNAVPAADSIKSQTGGKPGAG